MNRRNLLKGLIGVGVAGAAGAAVVEEEIAEYAGLAPLKQEGSKVAFDPGSYYKEVHEKYWEAQDHINQLYADRTVTWPDNVKWLDGHKPVLSEDGGDVIHLVTHDGGKTFFGSHVFNLK